MRKFWFILFTFFVFIAPIILESKSFVYFSPDHKPTNKLIELINNAKTKIHAAVYMITDHNIAQALAHAKKRGVDVQLIIDQSSINTPYAKGQFLKENNIDLYVFTQKSVTKKSRSKKISRFSALMHNKFALIDDQLWTGSFNWTKNANNRNQENIVVTDNKEIYQPFELQFKILQKRCVHLEAPKQKPQDNKFANDPWFSFDVIKEKFFNFVNSFKPYFAWL